MRKQGEGDVIATCSANLIVMFKKPSSDGVTLVKLPLEGKCVESGRNRARKHIAWCCLFKR